MLLDSNFEWRPMAALRSYREATRQSDGISSLREQCAPGRRPRIAGARRGSRRAGGAPGIA